MFSHTVDGMGAGGQRQVGGIIGRPEKGGAIRGEEENLHISEQGGCGDGANLRLVQMQGTHGSDPGQSPLMGGDGVVLEVLTEEEMDSSKWRTMSSLGRS